MRGLIQRVQFARVEAEGETLGEISRGLLLLLGVEKDDDQAKADKLLDKVLKYRVFPDENSKMNLGLKDTGGELLIVSQFTLVADTRKGLRPSFSSGASPGHGEKMYDYFVARARELYPGIATGKYAADMQVSLLNDGPVTFNLEV